MPSHLKLLTLQAWCLFLLATGTHGAVIDLNATWSRTPLSAWQRLDGNWTETRDHDLLAHRTVLVGENGLLLHPDKVGDFALTLRVRLDELRYQAYVPAAGFVFDALDRKTYTSITFDPRTGRLKLARLRAGVSTALAESPANFFVDLDRWFWFRVGRANGQVTAALSDDGVTWRAALTHALPSETGRAGLIGALPSLHFDFAPPPVVAVRDRHELVRTTPDALTATAIAEVFSAETKAQQLVLRAGSVTRTFTVPAGAGLRRVPVTLVFLPANTSKRVVIELRDGERVVFTREFEWENPLCAPAVTADPPPAPVVVAKPPTRADYLRAMQAVSVKAGSNGFNWLGRVLAYEVTHDPKLRAQLVEDARGLLKAFAERDQIPKGFTNFYQAMRVMQVVKRDALLTPEELARIPALVTAASIRGDYERGPMNRALGNFLGIAPALALVPDHPKKTELLQIKARLEADWTAARFEPLEDATNYQLITLYFGLQWALDEQRTDVLANPDFRSTFERLLAEFSPLGFVPAYGDDHDSSPGMLMGLFEAAARLWHDGRYRWAAQKIYARHYAGGTPPAEETVFGLALALAHVDESLAPVEPVARSQVLRRNDGTPGKLVLTSGHRPEDFYLLLDLLNGNEHGHNDELAVVSAMAGGHVLLGESGRYANAAQFKNAPLAVAAAEDFPLRRGTAAQTRRLRDNTLRPGEWVPFRLPLKRNWIWGVFGGYVSLPVLERVPDSNPDIDAAFNYDPARQFALLLQFRGEGRARAEVEGMKLVGPKETLALPDFPRGFDITIDGNAPYYGRVFDGPLDLKSGRFDWMEFRIKVQPDPASNAVLLCALIGDTDGYPKRFIQSNNPGGAVEVPHFTTAEWGAAAVLTSDRGALRVTRTVVFLKNRLAWIRDTFENRGATPLTCGALWHPRHATWRPDGWLDAGHGLRIALLPATGTSPTLIRHAIRDVLNPFVFSQSAALAPGGTATVDSILLVGAGDPRVAIAGNTLRLDGRDRARLGTGETWIEVLP